MFSLRNSMIKDSNVWQLTIEYFKTESLFISFLNIGALHVIGFLVISVFIWPLNAYRLPGNFYIVVLPFEGFSISWLLNYVHQTINAVVIITFYVTYTLMTMLLVNHACWKVDALILKVEELDESLGDKTDEMNKSLMTINMKLRKIVETSCNVNDWIKESQTILQFHFFVEFSLLSLVLGLTLCVISLNTSSSFEVYVIAIVPVFQLFLVCWLGNRLMIRSEKLSAALYDTKWYNLNISQQKDLQMVLTVTQSMKGFNVLFNEISIESFQQVNYE